MQALVALDERAARAKASIACGARSQTLRDAYAVIERTRSLRLQTVEMVAATANERDRLAALHLDASRDWKVVTMLEERALAARVAYAEHLEEWELGESNLGIAARAVAAERAGIATPSDGRPSQVLRRAISGSLAP